MVKKGVIIAIIIIILMIILGLIIFGGSEKEARSQNPENQPKLTVNNKIPPSPPVDEISAPSEDKILEDSITDKDDDVDIGDVI